MIHCSNTIVKMMKLCLLLMTPALLFFIAVRCDAFIIVQSSSSSSSSSSSVSPTLRIAATATATTQLYLFDDDNNNSNNDKNDSSSFNLASLNTRLREVKDKESIIPLVVFDAMLPRQSLTLNVNNAKLLHLIRECVLTKENPYIGMVGIARLSTGDYIHLKKGVEVEIIVHDKNNNINDDDDSSSKDNNKNDDDDDDDDDEKLLLPTDKKTNEDKGIKVTLKATERRFEIDQTEEKVGSTRTKTYCIEQNVDGGWTEAKVTYLSSAQEEQNEIRGCCGNKNDNDKSNNGCTSNEQTFYDRAAVARAILKSHEFTTSSSSSSPNTDDTTIVNSMNNNSTTTATATDNISLVDRWIELAKVHERIPGQIDTLLHQLGELPSADEPTERAFWIGALINPIPAMGVALEIRPALLTATKVEDRVDIALQGITQSIQHMSKKKIQRISDDEIMIN